MLEADTGIEQIRPLVVRLIVTEIDKVRGIQDDAGKDLLLQGEVEAVVDARPPFLVETDRFEINAEIPAILADTLNSSSDIRFVDQAQSRSKKALQRQGRASLVSRLGSTRVCRAPSA